MTCSATELLRGIVVQTTTTSFTGGYLYSDFFQDKWKMPDRTQTSAVTGSKDTVLNVAARVPLIGNLAGIIRVALGVFHTIAHLFAAIVSPNQKGHLYHAAKGGCEIVRGMIEAIPIIGYIFSINYSTSISDMIYRKKAGYSWWVIKIYNPDKPDDLDKHLGNWQQFQQIRPNGYIEA